MRSPATRTGGCSAIDRTTSRREVVTQVVDAVRAESGALLPRDGDGWTAAYG